jgi:hypothetical protein
MRTIAIVQAERDVAAGKLAELKRELKSLKAAERMRQRHLDPAYAEKLREGMRAMLADRERRESFIRSEREAARRRLNILPPMTDDQRLKYHKLRRHGIDRGEAILTVVGA